MKSNLLFIFILELVFTVFLQFGSLAFYEPTIESAQRSSSNSNILSRTYAAAAATSDLTVTVKNINTQVRSGAKVKLYNSDRSVLIGTLITDISGQAAFSGLSDGTYNYEVSYTPSIVSPIADNTEFWGSGQATITGSSQSVSFTRIQPYISVGSTFSPSVLNSGQSTSGSFTVKNILLYDVDSYVAVWIDRDKSSSWDFTQNISAKTISSGSTSAFPFTVTPTIAGSYYYYAFVYSKFNGNYVITDQYSWTQAFDVNDINGTISVELFDHNNTRALPGNKIIRYDQAYNLLDSKLTDTNGQANWTNISGGTYNFEGYNTALNSIWGDDLYWGSAPGIVISGTTNTLTITQSEPYIESIVLNGTVFGPGSTVHVEVTVKNPDSVVKTCKAEIRIDMDKMTPYDFESGFQSPLTIQPGQISVFGFDWTIPVNSITGTFYIASRVQTLTTKGYLSTDATNWDYSIINENSTISQIQWSGYTWNVKGGSALGPGPNNWLANSASVWVDEEDNLHLKIRKIGTKWYCAEISGKPLLGYGDYTFQVSSNVENLDKNIVLGLFTYESDTREIDIEFSRWNEPSNPAGWYNVQPSSTSSHKSFPLNLSENYSTHKFRWRPSEVFFQSYYGHYQYLPEKELLISEWVYTGTQIPPAGNERLILNFWLYKGLPPSDLKEAEVVIKSFTFKKVGDLIVQVQNIDNTSVPKPGSNGIVKLFNSENVLISTQKTNQSGSATFAGLHEGSGYYYQVFHTPANPATIYGQEYWGSKTAINIISDQTTSSIFKRNQPINGLVKVYNGLTDVTGQLVEPNTPLRIEQQILNYSSQVQIAKGSVTLDIDKIEPYDHQLTKTSFTSVTANGVVTQSWTITPAIKGKYYYSAGIQTLLNNNVQICDGSTWSLSPLFEVIPSFNIILNSTVDQKITQNSTAKWLFNLKNTGAVNDAFNLKTDHGTFFYQGKPITKTPILSPNEEINFELRFNSEMIAIATNGKIIISAVSNNDLNREKSIEVSYTIVQSDLVLKTNDVTSITFTTATSGGIITSAGGSTISAKGVCWSTTTNPTVYLDTKTTDGTGTAAFSSKITDLKDGITYHVKAYAINSLGAAYGNEVIFTTIAIKPPVANFSANPTSDCNTLTVQFSDQSSEDPTSWAWDIDNNGSVDYTTKNPIHTYNSAGTYSVKLTVTNSSGSDSKTLTNYITVNPTLLPTVRISAFPSPISETGQLVTFTAIPTNGGTNPKYQWKVDGMIVGGNSSNYSTTELTNGQIVSCSMTSNYACTSIETVDSNSISMVVNFRVSNEIISTNYFIQVYPNPTSGIITIEGLPENKKSRIAVYSANGKLIIKKMTSNATDKIDLSKQLSGTYLLMINNQSLKIIKK